MNFHNFTMEQRLIIREAYKKVMPKLMKGERLDPYGICDLEWIRFMSPIEFNVWSDIRELGLPFYPQVPCGPYFIDFANPSQGIAIEVDGSEWHQDIAKDKRREEFIKANGYSMFYRFQGRFTYGPDEDEDEFHEGTVRYWLAHLRNDRF